MCLAGGALIDWKLVKQTVVSVSTLESKYVALSKACLLEVDLRHLLKTISSEQSPATVVCEDNLGAVSTSRSSKITPRTKHVDIKFHHVRSFVADSIGCKVHQGRLPKGRHPHEELERTQVYFKPPHATR